MIPAQSLVLPDMIIPRQLDESQRQRACRDYVRQRV